MIYDRFVKCLLLGHALNVKISADLLFRVPNFLCLEDTLGRDGFNRTLVADVGWYCQLMISVDVVAKLARALLLLDHVAQWTALCVGQKPKTLAKELRVASGRVVFLTCCRVVKGRSIHDALQWARLGCGLSMGIDLRGDDMLRSTVALKLMDHRFILRAWGLLHQHSLKHRVRFSCWLWRLLSLSCCRTDSSV